MQGNGQCDVLFRFLEATYSVQIDGEVVVNPCGELVTASVTRLITLQRLLQ